MKIHRTTRFSAILLTVFFLIGSAAAHAGFFGPAPGGHGGPHGLINLETLVRLDLSAGQKAEVKKILDSYRAKREEKAAEFREARQRVRDAMTGEPFDETAIRTALRESAPAFEDMMVMRASMMAEMKSILTPAQLETLEQMKEERHSKRDKGRGEGRKFRQAMLDTWLQMDAD